MAKKEKQLIVRVCENKKTGQKYVTVPKKSAIEPGDYVRIEKVE